MSRKWLYQLLLLMNARSREDYFSKKSFVVALGMFIFAVGAFLGKQFSDSQNQSRLVQLSNCQNSMAASSKEKIKEIELANENDQKIDPLQDLSHLSKYAPAAAEIQKMADKEIERQISSEKLETKPEAVPEAEQKEVEKTKPAKKKFIKKQIKEVAKEEKKLDLYRLESENSIVEQAKKELQKQELEQQAKLELEQRTKEEKIQEAKQNVEQDASKNRKPSAVKRPTLTKLESVDYFGIDALPIGTYTLQLLSTQNEEEAKTFIEKLAADGIQAFYIKFKYLDNDAPIYRVCTGSFSNQNVAEKHFYQELDSKNPNLNFFVRKILK